MKDKVRIKSFSKGLTIQLDDQIPFDDLLKEVAAKFSEGRNFFGKETVALAFSGRKLTDEEMRESGAIDAGFHMGFTPVPGTTFGAMKKGQHGYTLDNDDYKIFYLEIGPGFLSADQAGTSVEGGSILEVGKKAIDLIESK